MQELLFIIWPEQPVLSIFISFILFSAVLYFARDNMHKLIKSVLLLVKWVNRYLYTQLNDLVEILQQRNLEVLLQAGQDDLDRQINKNFLQIYSTKSISVDLPCQLNMLIRISIFLLMNVIQV